MLLSAASDLGLNVCQYPFYGTLGLNGLTLNILGKKFQHTAFRNIFLFFPDNWRQFAWKVKGYFLWNFLKISVCHLLNLPRVVKVNMIIWVQVLHCLDALLYGENNTVFILSTVYSRYLEFQGTHWNTLRYPYFDISELREWGKQ